jgi:cation transport ATPase
MEYLNLILESNIWLAAALAATAFLLWVLLMLLEIQETTAGISILAIVSCVVIGVFTNRYIAETARKDKAALEALEADNARREQKERTRKELERVEEQRRDEEKKEEAGERAARYFQKRQAIIDAGKKIQEGR